MKSFLFLVVCSLCAVCGMSAVDAIETQQTLHVVETEALSCSKCHKPSCSGCGQVACSKCKSIILACKDGKKPGCTCPKEFTEVVNEELACKDGKKPGCTCPKEFTEAAEDQVAKCKCTDNGGFMVCNCKGKSKTSVIAGCSCTKKKVPAPVVPELL